jgi:hypothetical protein
MMVKGRGRDEKETCDGVGEKGERYIYDGEGKRERRERYM